MKARDLRTYEVLSAAAQAALAAQFGGTEAATRAFDTALDDWKRGLRSGTLADKLRAKDAMISALMGALFVTGQLAAALAEKSPATVFAGLANDLSSKEQ